MFEMPDRMAAQEYQYRAKPNRPTQNVVIAFGRLFESKERGSAKNQESPGFPGIECLKPALGYVSPPRRFALSISGCVSHRCLSTSVAEVCSITITRLQSEISIIHSKFDDGQIQ